MRNEQTKTGLDLKIPILAGEGFIAQGYGGKPLVYCLIELLKNCFDWFSSNVWINIDGNTIVIADNGCGMNAKNRISFCSVAKTSGDIKTQRAKFGTGSKAMLLNSRRVTVTTKAEGESEVIQFSLDSAEYQSLLFGHGNAEAIILDSSEWPEGMQSGTILHYDLTGMPLAKKLRKPDTIAEELAQKLPFVFRDAIMFNDNPLPPKELKGEPILQQFTYGDLGHVDIELYTLKGGTKKNNGVYLSCTNFGEVRIHDFMNLLPDNLRPLIPEVFLNTTELSGIITCRKLFGPHIKDDRASFDPEIANSELVSTFIQLLMDKENEVRTFLGLNETTETKSLVETMSQIRELSIKKYGAETNFGCEGIYVGDKLDKKDSIDADIRILGTERDYAIGDMIQLSVDINPKAKGADLKNVIWMTVNSGLTNIRISKDQRTLTGTATGIGWKTITVASGELKTQTSYRIVNEKEVYLSERRASPKKIGEEYRIYCYNVHLAAEPINWRVIGPGKMVVQGREKMQGSVIVAGSGVGELTVCAEAKLKNGKIFSDVCTIPIEDENEQLLKIMDHKFKIFCQPALDKKAFTIILGNGDPDTAVHLLYCNEKNKILQMPDAKKSLLPALIMLGEEYARFYYQDIEQEGTDVDRITAVKYEQLAAAVVLELTGVN